MKVLCTIKAQAFSGSLLGRIFKGRSGKARYWGSILAEGKQLPVLGQQGQCGWSAGSTGGEGALRPAGPGQGGGSQRPAAGFGPGDC